MLLGLALQAGAAEHTLTIKDYTCRGFAPDLVQYRVESLDRKQAAGLRLFDATGQSLPVQWTADPAGKGGLAGFVTALPHDESVTYRLTDSGTGPVAAGQLTVTAAKDKTVLGNGLFSVTLPAVVDQSYATPVKADTLPAPILSFTSGGSGVMGTSKMATSRLVKRRHVWLAAQGPVYADAMYELTWAEGGYYRCRVRVIDGVPLAQVMEEYDLGKLDGSDFWELSLTHGWQPDQVEKAKPWGNGTEIDFGSIEALPNFTKQAQWRMSVDNGLLGHLGFTCKSNNTSLAGVVLLRKGDWRRVNVLEVQVVQPDDVRVRFPMSARDMTWQRDSGSVSSPFSMHSLDPEVAPTYGRRHWGLQLAPVHLPKEEGAAAFFGPAYKGFADQAYKKLPPFSRARSLYGIITLDHYKDYILDWPDTQVAYPRLARIGGSAGGTAPSPNGAGGTVPAVGGSGATPTNAQSGATPTNTQSGATPTNAQDLKHLYDRYLRWIPNFYMSCPTPTHHATGDLYVGAWLADHLLGSPDLTPEQRRDIRARVALALYLHQEPATLSYGIGSHPGNPNMGWARFFPGVAYLGLLPDHPQYLKWADFMSKQAEYELGKGMAPGGAWLEYGAYHFHGFRALPMLASIDLAKPANADTLFDYAHADLDYIMNLLSAPDPRFRSRMIPGLANSGPATTSRLVEGANAFAKKDSEFAAQLLWAWNENGSMPGALPAPAGLPPRPADLSSRYYPGFGIIFRAHQGPQETWLMLRNGFLWSHWNIDPGHFVMASRGAVLVPFQEYQYGGSPDKTFDICNTVRFGDPHNTMPYGWPDSNILDYSFGKSVDYAWSSTGLPDWFIDPAAAEPFQNEIPKRALAAEFQQQQGAFQWDRQVLFLKGKTATSPNYFVFRDSTRGDGKLASYLNMNLLGRKSNLKIDGAKMTLDSEWPVKLDLLFAQSEPVTPALLEADESFQLAEANKPAAVREGAVPPALKGEVVSRDWLDKNWAVWKTGDGKPTREQRLLLRIPAAPDQGYFYVLFPRDEKEAPPVVKRLADGVLSVTHREGTDYVFLSSLPVKYAGDGVQLEGCAGAVRVAADAVTFTLAGGGGCVGYKGKVVEGSAPFEKSYPLAGWSAGVEKINAMLSSCSLQPREGAVPPAPSTAAPSTAALVGVEPDPPRIRDAGEEVAPGLRKKIDGERTRYSVQAERLVQAKTETVQVEACHAVIEVAAKSVRFIVPDRQYARLSVAGVGIRGCGPFDLTFTPTSITGTVDGTLRTLVSTWPDKITRPMFRMDGRLWCAGWADDPCISKTPDRPQFAIAFGVFAGSHKVEISEWQFPAMPPVPPVARVEF